MEPRFRLVVKDPKAFREAVKGVEREDSIYAIHEHDYLTAIDLVLEFLGLELVPGEEAK